MILAGILISPYSINLIDESMRNISADIRQIALSLLKTKLTGKEKLFCMAAYTPKATVQAAIGAVPLTMGLPCGNLVLTIAVLSILI